MGWCVGVTLCWVWLGCGVMLHHFLGVVWGDVMWGGMMGDVMWGRVEIGVIRCGVVSGVWVWVWVDVI